MPYRNYDGVDKIRAGSNYKKDYCNTDKSRSGNGNRNLGINLGKLGHQAERAKVFRTSVRNNRKRKNFFAAGHFSRKLRRAVRI